jgi:FYVE/RhoGEF/PH domain-containing protein 5/6
MKRGELVMIERNKTEWREFLLFSDCLVWLVKEGVTRANVNIRDISDGREDGGESSSAVAESDSRERHPLVRSRSKSENELPRLKARVAGPSPRQAIRHSVYPAGLASMTEEQERWEYKGKTALVDLEVVVPRRRLGMETAEGEERRLEVLSPEGSFVVYAGGIYFINSPFIRSSPSWFVVHSL